MQIWRIHLKSDSIESIDPRKFCLDNKWVGVGWRAPITGPFKTPDDYKAAAESIYKGNKSWHSAINAICYNLAEGDLIWTRDRQGIYYLGRIIDNKWEYLDLPDHQAADMFNVRRCQWLHVGGVDVVPGRIVSSFYSSKTIQRILDETVAQYSQFIINQPGKEVCGPILDTLIYTPELFAILSPDDCEDLLGLYLQLERDYVLIPSSCKPDTMNYEYALINKLTGRPAYVQVKKGTIDLNFNDFSELDGDVYLCTTKGTYLGRQKPNMHIIEPATLLEFIPKALHCLPAKLKNRLSIYQQIYQPLESV